MKPKNYNSCPKFDGYYKTKLTVARLKERAFYLRQKPRFVVSKNLHIKHYGYVSYKNFINTTDLPF